MEITIAKTKIKPGVEWIGPNGTRFKYVGFWQKYHKGERIHMELTAGAGWHEASPQEADWLNSIFEVEKPLRTKVWRDTEFREDYRYRPNLRSEVWDKIFPGDSELYALIRDYEKWDQ